MSSVPEQKEPIDGWLIVFAIALWIALFIYLMLFVGSLAILPFHDFLHQIDLVQDFIGTIMSVILLVLFIRRKAAFVKLYIAYQIYAAVLETVLLVVHFYVHKSMVSNFVRYSEIIVIVLYLLRSKRVKRTFVR